MIYLAFVWVWRLFDTTTFPTPLHDRPLLIYSVAALLLGAQMMSIGFLAELITAYQGRDEDSFSVAEQTDRRPPVQQVQGAIPVPSEDATQLLGDSSKEPPAPAS